MATAATPVEPRYPTFTDSGRFVAATLDDGQIVTSGLTAGSSRIVPAHSERVFAGGGDSITWWESPDQLVTLDLSNPASAPSKKQIVMPDAATGPTRLISFAGRTAVFLQEGAAPGGGDELIEMAGDQSPHRVGAAPDTPIRVAFPRPDGQAFAYAPSIRAACPKNAVSVLTVNTDETTSPPMPYATDSIATTQRIWWDTDGLLHMSLAERPCTGSGDSSTEKLTTWKLNGDNWIAANPDSVLVSRPLNNDAVALVTPTKLKPPSGVLWVESHGDRKQIAENVTDLATPASQPQSTT